jgi:hypothetical protein
MRNTTMRNTTNLLSLSVLCLALLTPSIWAQDKVTPDEAKKDAAAAQENIAYALGIQAYLYGQPIMDLYRTFWENTLDPKRDHDRTLNEFNYVRKLVTPKDNWVVTPNNDTLYSRGWLDLTDEPIVLHIPDMGTRKYWFPLGDMYHNLYRSLDWQTIGYKGGDFALTAPGWQGLLPDGVGRIKMTTPMMWTLGRVQVDGEKDVPAVKKLQDKTFLVPLSQWKKDMTKAPRAKIDPSRYPKMTNADMSDAEKFFTVMNEMLRRNPPVGDAQYLLGWLREIHLAPDQQFVWNDLDKATQKGLTRATKDALAIIAQREKTFAAPVNGWIPAIMPGDQSNMPLYHAAVTKLGLLYSQKEVSTYHVGFVDGDGKPLDGSSTYTLKLAPPPPVEAFWSLTMYDAKTKLFVDNKSNRYAIGDRTAGLKTQKDGSVTITISPTEPSDAEATANWLPAPKGSFYMVLREYSPGPAVLNGGWLPPKITKVK